MSKLKEHRNSRMNYELKSEFMEHPKGKSMAVPDDSYTIRELIERFQNGIPLSQHMGNFDENVEGEEADHDDQDLEKFNKMDIAEQSEILREARELMLTEREKKERDLQAKRQAEEDRRFNEAIAEAMRKREEESGQKEEEKKAPKKTLPSSTK